MPSNAFFRDHLRSTTAAFLSVFEGDRRATLVKREWHHRRGSNSRRVTNEGLQTPFGALAFSPETEPEPEVVPLHQAGLELQRRLMILRLNGHQPIARIDLPEFDWELRANAAPYDGIRELLVDYRLGNLTDSAQFEVVPGQVIAIENTSRVSGEKATIAVICAKRIRREEVLLGYRTFSSGAVQSRNSISGRDVKWEIQGDLLRGSSEITVPPGAVVHAIASYTGIAEHYLWIGDPDTAQNHLRAVYVGFDSNFATLRDFLTREPGTGNARDLEIGVSWLLWMLGFSAAAIGRTQNTPDILAVTPRGRYLVIECTTGGLASTVSVLLARTGLVRQRLQSSGHSAEVLPVLVTSKHREDVKADIPAAEQNGVVVVTREDLLTLVDRTFVLRSADVLFDEIVAVLKSRTEETAEGI